MLQVTTGTELHCRERIAEAGIEAVVPTRIMPELRGGEWREREIVMLPGYVFVHCRGTVPDYYRLSAIQDTIRILPGGGRYDPVPDEQMQWILTLANGGEPWGISEAVLGDGWTIRVLSGPLIGRESEIVSWDRRRRRAKICIRVLEQQRMIDVGLKEGVT